MTSLEVVPESAVAHICARCGAPATTQLVDNHWFCDSCAWRATAKLWRLISGAPQCSSCGDELVTPGLCAACQEDGAQL